LVVKEQRGWVRAFLQEVITMPRRHVLVFLLATILLIIVDVEVVEEWHPIRLFELLGLMLFLYMGWVTWRVARMLKR
jgi:uncharacterized membrane protein YoaT (DUF817 family)